LSDCTKNGCVVYHGKRIIGGISRNEITNAQWDTCGTNSPNSTVKPVEAKAIR
jgi:hypothetical protein